MSNDTSRTAELAEKADTAVEEAFRKVNGAVPDSDAIWDTLYALYDAGFADGQQHEYSYPS